MVDMEKVKALTSILEERSGLGVREALVRYYNFLKDDEAWDYDFELDFFSINSILRWIFRSDFCSFGNCNFGFL